MSGRVKKKAQGATDHLLKYVFAGILRSSEGFFKIYW